MDRVDSAAIGKLAITVALAVAFLILYKCWPDGPFAGLAVGGFILVAGPVLILVLVDTGRALRHRHLGRTAEIASWLPQLILGLMACLAGAGGTTIAALGPSEWPIWRVCYAFVSLGLFLYGVNLLKSVKAGVNQKGH